MGCGSSLPKADAFLAAEQPAPTAGYLLPGQRKGQRHVKAFLEDLVSRIPNVSEAQVRM